MEKQFTLLDLYIMDEAFEYYTENEDDQECLERLNDLRYLFFNDTCILLLTDKDGNKSYFSGFFNDDNIIKATFQNEALCYKHYKITNELINKISNKGYKVEIQKIKF